MNFFNSKYFSLLALLCLFSVPVQADRYDYDRGVEYRDNCCNQYVCGCNPLYCGAADLQIHAGIVPISWHDRGEFSIIQCGGGPLANPLIPLFGVPKFRKFFKLPWTVGLQVGYALSDNVRVYVEFDYIQASRKRDVSLVSVGATPITILFNPVKYKLFDIYFGARYYFDRWCDKVSFFIGLKAGVSHHRRVRFSSTFTPPVPAVVFTDDLDLFRRNTVPSGGIDFGLDFCYCGNWSFVLTGGVLAACGPRGTIINFGQPGGCTAVNQPNLPVANVHNFIIGGVGTELRFPITLGVRYSF